MFFDPPDYDEIEATRAECREEYDHERLEKLGLIPEEHNHGWVQRSGEVFKLDCLDCHDESECDSLECIFCIPGF